MEEIQLPACLPPRVSICGITFFPFPATCNHVFLAQSVFNARHTDYFFYHQAVSFGASSAGGVAVTMLAAEVCENVNSIGAHLAFLRGAARQYGVSFAVDVSPWFAGLVPDFANVSGPWAGTAGQVCKMTSTMNKQEQHVADQTQLAN
jgi:hypothetical protein